MQGWLRQNTAEAERQVTASVNVRGEIGCLSRRACVGLRWGLLRTWRDERGEQIRSQVEGSDDGMLKKVEKSRSVVSELVQGTNASL